MIGERTEVAGSSMKTTIPHKDIALIFLGASVVGIMVFAAGSVALPAGIKALFAFIRLILGLAYVLYVPGYCITAVLFPRADDLDGIERNGLSLGLSVAWVPVLALILNWLWDLSLIPVMLGLLASIVVFSGAAVWRRERLPAGEAFAPSMAWRPRPWWRELPTLDRRVYLLSAGALLVAALAAAWIFLIPSPDEFMTEFYILGRGGLAEDYPRVAAVGEPLRVTMGIVNREREPMVYRVEVWAVDPWNDERRLVNEIGPFSLMPGEAIQQEITWRMPWAGDDLITDFNLYTEGQEGVEPYRLLRLWLNVNKS